MRVPVPALLCACKGRPAADKRRPCLILEEFGSNRKPAIQGGTVCHAGHLISGTAAIIAKMAEEKNGYLGCNFWSNSMI